MTKNKHSIPELMDFLDEIIDAVDYGLSEHKDPSYPIFMDSVCLAKLNQIKDSLVKLPKPITRGDLEDFYIDGFPGRGIKEIPLKQYEMIMNMVDRLIKLLKSKNIPIIEDSNRKKAIELINPEELK